MPLATNKGTLPAYINSPSPCVQHVGVADAQDAAAIPQVCEAQPTVGTRAFRLAEACHSWPARRTALHFARWAASVLADLLHQWLLSSKKGCRRPIRSLSGIVAWCKTMPDLTLRLGSRVLPALGWPCVGSLNSRPAYKSMHGVLTLLKTPDSCSLPAMSMLSCHGGSSVKAGSWWAATQWATPSDMLHVPMEQCSCVISRVKTAHWHGF